MAVELQTGPTDEAYLNLALVHRAEGQYEQALAYAQKALEMTPDYEEAKMAFTDIEQALEVKKGR